MPDWGWFHKAFGRSFKSFHTNKFTTFLYFSYVQLFAMLFMSSVVVQNYVMFIEFITSILVPSCGTNAS